MMRRTRGGLATLTLCVGLALLGGCNVTPSQVLALRTLLPSEEKRAARALEAEAWRFDFAGAAYLVYPINGPDGTIVFTNRTGLRVVFDGEEIIAIEKLPGAFGKFALEKRPGQRVFRRDGKGSFTARCDEARDWQLSENRRGRRLECRGTLEGVAVVTRHEVERNGRGDVTKITSTLVPGVAPIVMQPISLFPTPK